MKKVGFEWYKARTSKPVLQDLLLELYLMVIRYTQTSTNQIPYPNSTGEKQAVRIALLTLALLALVNRSTIGSMKRYIEFFRLNALLVAYNYLNLLITVK